MGIISYNETLLRDIILCGKAIISVDFSQMGKSMAEKVIVGKKENIDNPFILKATIYFNKTIYL